MKPYGADNCIAVGGGAGGKESFGNTVYIPCPGSGGKGCSGQIIVPHPMMDEDAEDAL